MVKQQTTKWICMVLIAVLLFTSFSMKPLYSEAAGGDLASTITFNPIPSEVHRTTDRYVVKANDVELPVVDGYYTTTIIEDGKQRTIKPDFLNYDYTTFSASEGAVELVIKGKEKIPSISVSPIKLNIKPVKVDDYTYKITIEQDYYLILTINNKQLVVARDNLETDVPVPGAEGVFNILDNMDSMDSTKQENVTAVTAAIQKAADDASVYGTAKGNGAQGVLYIPAGLYYMGNLMLNSNTAMYLAPGAVLRVTDDYSHYSKDFYKSSLNRDGTWWIVTGDGSDNIKVYGRGTLDGNGHYLGKDKPTTMKGFAVTALMAMGTSNFTYDGPIIKDTPFWGFIVARSNDVHITNYKHLNSLDANENDCLDVNESQNVTVDKAIGISLDDPFSTKTWEGAGMMLNWYGQPEKLENVSFNNLLSWTYCAAFKMGHGSFQDQSNVSFRNSVAFNSGRAIGIEHVYGSGSFSNILFENIEIEGAGDEGWLKIVIENTGQGAGPISNVTLRNINVMSKGKASSLHGYNDEIMVDGVTLENIRMLGNPNYVTSLSELNITKTEFSNNVMILPTPDLETNYRIEAEYANALEGVNWENKKTIAFTASNDIDSLGYMVKDIANNNYALFRNVDFGSNTSEVSIRFDAPRAVKVELHKDSPTGELIGSKDLPGNNGSWKKWNTYDIPVNGASGVQNLYVVFKISGSTQTNQLLGSLNWIELNRSFTHLQSVTPDNPEVELHLTQSANLGLNFAPTDAYNTQVVWSIAEQSEIDVIALTDTGRVTALNAGTAMVRATSLENSSLYAEFEITVLNSDMPVQFVPPVDLITKAGDKVELPSQIDLLYLDNSKRKADVQWEPIDETVFELEGDYVIHGTVVNTDINVTATLHIKNADNLVRMAFVGDGVTFGSGAKVAYPDQVNIRLGTGNEVGTEYNAEKFAFKDASLLKKSTNSFWNNGAYANSLQSNPDVVVVGFGTSDAETVNWVYADDYVADYLELIEAYKNLPSQPIVYIALPPAVNGAGARGITNDSLAQVITKIWEVSKLANVPVIDNNTLTQGLNSSMFTDSGIHPTEEGAAMLADNVITSIRGKDLTAKSGVIPAIHYSTMFGVNVQHLADVNKYVINGTHGNDWVRYDNIDFDNIGQISLQLSSGADEKGIIELRLDSQDGTLIGSIEVTKNSSNWRDFIKKTVDLERIKGNHDLYLVFKKSSDKTVVVIHTIELVTKFWETPVQTISITGGTTVKVGSTTSFQAVVTPEDSTDKSVSWTVTDEAGNPTELADMDANTGMLEANAIGTVKVTAAALDASGVKSELIVAIVPEETELVKVTGITLSGAVSVEEGSISSLTATVTPDNAADKSLLWAVYDNDGNSTDLASISQSGELTALKPGMAKITATAMDGSNMMGEYQITITAKPVVIPGDGNNQNPGGGNSGGNDDDNSDSDTPVVVVPVKPVEPTEPEKEQPAPVEETKPAVDEKTGIELSRDSNVKFISGYSDGTVRPDGEVNRAEFAQILYKLVMNSDKDSGKAGENFFKDVSTDAWYSEAIGYLSSKGLLGGYEDKTFKPNKALTRAELASVLARFAPAEGSVKNKIFEDVTGHWAEAEIRLLADSGFISGYPDGTFKPDELVSRAECIVMIIRVLWGAADSEFEDPRFSDLTPDHWAYKEIIQSAVR